MSKRNPRAKWVLPTVINPPKKICFQIQVPDEKYHIAAFLGALYNLTSAIFWSDDRAHTAKKVARVWQDIYDNISRQCATEFINTYVVLEDDMPFFRQICENDICYLEFECCPGEWIRLGNADQIPVGTQPGSGSPQPPPNGGIANYCAQMLATNKFLIPTVLNAGDTISIQANGAGNGGASDPLPLRWYCVDGQDFFAGACGGGTINSGLDPLPATPHFSMIINVGGTFYPLPAGLFTIPGGIINQPAYIQINDSNLADNSGGYQICVTIVNNQLGSWAVDLDLSINQHGLIATDFTPFPEPTITAWVAGKGFVGTGGGFGDYTVGTVLLPISGSGFIDQIIATAYSEGHAGDNQLASLSIGGTVVSPASDYQSAIVASTNAPIDHTIIHTVPLSSTPQWVKFDLYQNAAPFGDIVLSRLRITGRGFNPFA